LQACAIDRNLPVVGHTGARILWQVQLPVPLRAGGVLLVITAL
jgi:hypothetical protein